MFPNHVWKDANDFCYLLFGNLPIVSNAFANNAVLGMYLGARRGAIRNSD